VTPEPQLLVAARRQLHAVAENFIAGPQYRRYGTIRLRVGPDGFAGVALGVAVQGTTLVWASGSMPLAGSVADVIAESGVDVGPAPADVYPAAAPLHPGDVLDIDPDAAAIILRTLYAGHLAARQIAPQEDPVLWAEHFDVGIAAGEVNYGVSPGDDAHPLPYAYVGPWDIGTHPRSGAVWNAPFGALHPLDRTVDPEQLAAEVTEFFRLVQSRL
jgi:hypothetical protein